MGRNGARSHRSRLENPLTRENRYATFSFLRNQFPSDDPRLEPPSGTRCQSIRLPPSLREGSDSPSGSLHTTSCLSDSQRHASSARQAGSSQESGGSRSETRKSSSQLTHPHSDDHFRFLDNACEPK